MSIFGIFPQSHVTDKKLAGSIAFSALGHDIIIEGTGDAEIRVFAAGQYICFRMRNCWHVPSSSHHFLSCTTTTSSGHQVMITARTPRILFSNSRRLAEPRLPKYVPLTKVDGYWVLKFEIPAQGPISSQLPSTVVQTAAQTAPQATTSLHASMHQLEPFAALSHLQPHLPPFSFAPVDFRSAAMISMVSQYNALLDSRSRYHIVRDRRLFCSFAEKSISVDTANCGSLEALGIGDVEFRCPFRDRHVVFTLRGCLYAPDAPINLLSVNIFVERGLSCLFSSGGLTKVFYPQNHSKLPGFTFSAVVMNQLSFLNLVFIPPVDSVFPHYMPFEQPSSSSPSLLFAGLTSNNNLLLTPSPQHPDVVSNTSTVQVVASASDLDAMETVGPGMCKHVDDMLTTSTAQAVALPVHGGAQVPPVENMDSCFLLNDDVNVMSHGRGMPGTAGRMLKPMDVKVDGNVNGDAGDQAADAYGSDPSTQLTTDSESDSFPATLNSSIDVFNLPIEDYFSILLSSPSSPRTSSLSRPFTYIPHIHPTCFLYFLFLYSRLFFHNSLFHLFALEAHSELPTFTFFEYTSVPQLLVPFSSHISASGLFIPPSLSFFFPPLLSCSYLHFQIILFSVIFFL